VQIKGFTSRERVRGTAISSNAEIFCTKDKAFNRERKENKKGAEKIPAPLVKLQNLTKEVLD
jgi:hypothetical protein